MFLKLLIQKKYCMPIKPLRKKITRYFVITGFIVLNNYIIPNNIYILTVHYKCEVVCVVKPRLELKWRAFFRSILAPYWER